VRSVEMTAFTGEVGRLEQKRSELEAVRDWHALGHSAANREVSGIVTVENGQVR
jgi:hypothetical protein